MLPRSCLRLALSKSNSSTRLPRSTTTRVSSGWVASINILSAIGKSHWAANSHGLARRRRKSNVRGVGLIGVEGKGRVAKAHTSARRHDGGAWVMNLKIPLLRQWQHETCDPYRCGRALKREPRFIVAHSQGANGFACRALIRVPSQGFRHFACPSADLLRGAVLDLSGRGPNTAQPEL